MATNWDTAEILKTPMEICWQFDYEIRIEKLRSLYSKSKRLQWDAEIDIDWSPEIDPSRPLIDEGRFAYDRMPFMQKLSDKQRENFRAQVAAHALSQFLHGEQGALMTAAALTHAVPDYEGKLYVATQTMDEARHVEVYRKYIDKLAIIYPISKGLKALIDATLQADHWIKIAIGMNMIIEGLALAAFHNMRRATTCGLLKQVTEYVLRDEARHVAFGNVYVGESLGQMHSDDREDVADFAFMAVKMMADSRRRGASGDPDPGFLQVIENSEIEVSDFLEGMAEARREGIRPAQAPGEVHSFRDLMMPALVRVGAVTERSRELYAEAKIPVFEDTAVLESLEEADTGIVSV